MVAMKYSHLLSSLLIVSVLCISACSSKDKSIESKLSAEDMYEEATADLAKRSYNSAVELFEDIERTYPYSPLATKSKLMAGYTQYRDGQYDSAINSLERFIKLHPGNKDVAYAYYLKSLCYYEQITDVGRDQGITESARAALKELVARFPESEYARDATLKIDLVQDHLAGKEMEVGRFYLKNGEAVAAINRFKKVVNDYQTTAHIPEALHRLVESYLMLGVVPEAQKYAAVLGNNFPGSKWYQQSFNLMESKGFTFNKNAIESKTPSVLDKVWPFSSEETVKTPE